MTRLFDPLLVPKSPVTRFAPSPTGYLHLGHVLSMAYVFAIAENIGAKVLLRIEDHDRQRCRKEYEQAIFDDMAWLGFFPHNWSSLRFRQSDRSDRYQEILEHLTDQDRLYYCSCSRKTITATSTRPMSQGDELFYPGTCRHKGLEAEKGLGVRLRVGENSITSTDLLLGALEQTPAHQCGDYLLRDNHGNYTYNLAVVVDDIDQEVNLIVRGQDLLHCVGRQVQLWQLLEQREPPRFAHHPLIKDETGKKLSKRWLAEGVIKRRLSGDSPDDVLGEALWLGGWLEASRPVKAQQIPGLFAEAIFTAESQRSPLHAQNQADMK